MQEWAEAMAQDNAWGDEVLIDTFSRFFAVQVIVYSPLNPNDAGVRRPKHKTHDPRTRDPKLEPRNLGGGV